MLLFEFKEWAKSKGWIELLTQEGANAERLGGVRLIWFTAPSGRGVGIIVNNKEEVVNAASM